MRKLLKKKKSRIGILGGTFDPPHIGHIKISKIALKYLKLKNVYWILTNQNPLKSKPNFDLKTRINLSKKILKTQKKITVKRLNKKLSSQNTFNLLRFLKKRNKKKDLFFLMGADNLINFHKWYNWKKIPRLSKIIVFSRPSFSTKALDSIAAKKLNKRDWMYINFTRLNISSSKLKKI